MDFQFRRYDNTTDNISMAVFATYTNEEFEALAKSGAAVQPCIHKINPTVSFWNGTVTIYNPTFLQLVDPGILIEGFTEFWANQYQNDFNYWYGDSIRAKLAPILQWFRREQHRELERQRDSYYGAQPNLPYRNPPKLLR